MAEKKRSTARKRTARPRAEAAHKPPVRCPHGFCPICNAIDSMQGAGPDVISHLMASGRELLLAAKAAIDAADGAGAAGRPGRGSKPLEKIDVG